MPLVYQSRCMEQVLERVRRFARGTGTVLITGESGTGKELIARAIHEESPRGNGPFVAVNCAALTSGLIESELFGHEPGAFTGATAERIGRFEAACNGTILLDEIGELRKGMQAKLLRVLEDGEFQRVGSNMPRFTNARVIASTNVPLAKAVQKRRFRADLFHRLGVLHIEVPPLRERREDVPALVTHFVQRFRNEAASPVKGVSTEVMRQLSRHEWPGNIRELRNVIHRACLLANDELIDAVEFVDFEEADTEPNRIPASFQRLSLREIERQVIMARLRLFDGNKTEAAAALGVTPRTLRNKMVEYRKLGYAG